MNGQLSINDLSDFNIANGNTSAFFFTSFQAAFRAQNAPPDNLII